MVWQDQISAGTAAGICIPWIASASQVGKGCDRAVTSHTAVAGSVSARGCQTVRNQGKRGAGSGCFPRQSGCRSSGKGGCGRDTVWVTLFENSAARSG